MTLGPQFRRIIQEADRFVRYKKYRCLVQGCNELAIRSHAIQRASLVEALAENGAVYSMRQSFNPLMQMTALDDPIEVEPLNVNYASVFPGFCGSHDARLFAPAETNDRKKKKYIFISLHLRAAAIEYCRKRRNVDFNLKVASLTNHAEFRKHNEHEAAEYAYFCHEFQRVILAKFTERTEGISYFCIPFSTNLRVSCCGVFNESASLESTIGFNLISYSDMSLLVLTTFKSTKRHLDSFLSAYETPFDPEALVNEIAFSKCEEPLISPRLWHSLTDEERLAVKRSLRPPAYRETESTPRIIRLTSADVMGEITPSLMARLPVSLLADGVSATKK